MGIEENDESVVEEVLAELANITAVEERMRLETLLSGEYDGCNAIVSFHPGAGGTEAQDWASMLYRMYNRWAENKGFTVKLLEWLDGDEAGLKSATILVEGPHAYGFLKSEHGVHRLVRVSPFDASGRRQTSFASVEVTPELDDSVDIEIREEDIEVTAHRSSGAGGQHINKTDSAIRIVHKPTGIVVGCQTERSQLQNKETALRMLKSKLAEIKERENLDKIEDIRGEKTRIEWGSQIRSYVFMPYTLAKDTRTGYEDGNIDAVMDGEIDGFINAFLKSKA
jgi:peptide chain release factor 2